MFGTEHIPLPKRVVYDEASPLAAAADSVTYEPLNDLLRQESAQVVFGLAQGEPTSARSWHGQRSQASEWCGSPLPISTPATPRLNQAPHPLPQPKALRAPRVMAMSGLKTLTYDDLAATRERDHRAKVDRLLEQPPPTTPSQEPVTLELPPQTERERLWEQRKQVYLQKLHEKTELAADAVSQWTAGGSSSNSNASWAASQDSRSSRCSNRSQVSADFSSCSRRHSTSAPPHRRPRGRRRRRRGTNPSQQDGATPRASPHVAARGDPVLGVGERDVRPAPFKLVPAVSTGIDVRGQAKEAFVRRTVKTDAVAPRTNVFRPVDTLGAPSTTRPATVRRREMKHEYATSYREWKQAKEAAEQRRRQAMQHKARQLREEAAAGKRPVVLVPPVLALGTELNARRAQLDQEQRQLAAEWKRCLPEPKDKNHRPEDVPIEQAPYFQLGVEGEELRHRGREIATQVREEYLAKNAKPAPKKQFHPEDMDAPIHHLGSGGMSTRVHATKSEEREYREWLARNESRLRREKKAPQFEHALPSYQLGHEGAERRQRMKCIVAQAMKEHQATVPAPAARSFEPERAPGFIDKVGEEGKTRKLANQQRARSIVRTWVKEKAVEKPAKQPFRPELLQEKRIGKSYERLREYLVYERNKEYNAIQAAKVERARPKHQSQHQHHQQQRQQPQQIRQPLQQSHQPATSSSTRQQ